MSYFCFRRKKHLIAENVTSIFKQLIVILLLICVVLITTFTDKGYSTHRTEFTPPHNSCFDWQYVLNTPLYQLNDTLDMDYANIMIYEIDDAIFVNTSTRWRPCKMQYFPNSRSYTSKSHISISICYMYILIYR